VDLDAKAGESLPAADGSKLSLLHQGGHHWILYCHLRVLVPALASRSHQFPLVLDYSLPCIFTNFYNPSSVNCLHLKKVNEMLFHSNALRRASVHHSRLRNVHMIDFYDYGKLWYYMEWRVDMMALVRGDASYATNQQAHTATSFYASRQGK